MHAFEIAGELSRLYALEIEAAHAYSEALILVPPGSLHDELRLYGLEHQRHALVLLDAILRLGQSPPEVEPDVKGVVIGALTLPRRRLTLEDVLSGMRGNEQLTNSVYAKVLAKPLPEPVREMLEPLLEDERQHLDWLDRMVSRRVWDVGAGVHP